MKTYHIVAIDESIEGLDGLTTVAKTNNKDIAKMVFEHVCNHDNWAHCTVRLFADETSSKLVEEFEPLPR